MDFYVVSHEFLARLITWDLKLESSSFSEKSEIYETDNSLWWTKNTSVYSLNPSFVWLHFCNGNRHLMCNWESWNWTIY